MYHMKKHLKIVIALLLACIVIFVLTWRLWPYTYTDVISTDENSLTSLSCTTTISGITKDGTSYIDTYQLQSLTRASEGFNAILDILNSSAYRQGFQNLLPGTMTSIDSDDNSNESVVVSLVWGNHESDTCNLVFYEDGRVVVSLGTKEGFLIYHTTDNSILDRLADYVQEHGVKN